MTIHIIPRNFVSIESPSVIVNYIDLDNPEEPYATLAYVAKLDRWDLVKKRGGTIEPEKQTRSRSKKA